MKGKFYKTFVRPEMIYGSECRAINKKMKLAEMIMLRWTCGVTRID